MKQGIYSVSTVHKKITNFVAGYIISFVECYKIFDKLYNVVCSKGEVFGRDGYRRYREDTELGNIG
jgi:hypothetical protein